MFEFPCKAPDDTIILGDMTAVEQLENWKVWKLNFTEHNPSCFSGETRFITDQGLKRFDSFKDGASVRVMGPDGLWTDGTVRQLGTQEIWDLTVKRQRVTFTVRTTGNHIWPVSTNQSRFNGWAPKLIRTDSMGYFPKGRY